MFSAFLNPLKKKLASIKKKRKQNKKRKEAIKQREKDKNGLHRRKRSSFASESSSSDELESSRRSSSPSSSTSPTRSSRSSSTRSSLSLSSSKSSDTKSILLSPVISSRTASAYTTSLSNSSSQMGNTSVSQSASNSLRSSLSESLSSSKEGSSQGETLTLSGSVMSGNASSLSTSSRSSTLLNRRALRGMKSRLSFTTPSKSPSSTGGDSTTLSTSTTPSADSLLEATSDSKKTSSTDSKLATLLSLTRSSYSSISSSTQSTSTGSGSTISMSTSDSEKRLSINGSTISTSPRASDSITISNSSGSSSGTSGTDASTFTTSYTSSLTGTNTGSTNSWTEASSSSDSTSASYTTSSSDSTSITTSSGVISTTGSSNTSGSSYGSSYSMTTSASSEESSTSSSSKSISLQSAHRSTLPGQLLNRRKSIKSQFLTAVEGVCVTNTQNSIISRGEKDLLLDDEGVQPPPLDADAVRNSLDGEVTFSTISGSPCPTEISVRYFPRVTGVKESRVEWRRDTVKLNIPTNQPAERTCISLPSQLAIIQRSPLDCVYTVIKQVAVQDAANCSFLSRAESSKLPNVEFLSQQRTAPSSHSDEIAMEASQSRSGTRLSRRSVDLLARCFLCDPEKLLGSLIPSLEGGTRRTASIGNVEDEIEEHNLFIVEQKWYALLYGDDEDRSGYIPLTHLQRIIVGCGVGSFKLNLCRGRVLLEISLGFSKQCLLALRIRRGCERPLIFDLSTFTYNIEGVQVNICQETLRLHGLEEQDISLIRTAFEACLYLYRQLVAACAAAADHDTLTSSDLVVPYKFFDPLPLPKQGQCGTPSFYSKSILRENLLFTLVRPQERLASLLSGIEWPCLAAVPRSTPLPKIDGELLEGSCVADPCLGEPLLITLVELYVPSGDVAPGEPVFALASSVGRGRGYLSPVRVDGHVAPGEVGSTVRRWLFPAECTLALFASAEDIFYCELCRALPPRLGPDGEAVSAKAVMSNLCEEQFATIGFITARVGQLSKGKSALKLIGGSVRFSRTIADLKLRPNCCNREGALSPTLTITISGRPASSGLPKLLLDSRLLPLLRVLRERVRSNAHGKHPLHALRDPEVKTAARLIEASATDARVLADVSSVWKQLTRWSKGGFIKYDNGQLDLFEALVRVDAIYSCSTIHKKGVAELVIGKGKVECNGKMNPTVY